MDFRGKRINKSWLREWLNYFANAANLNANAHLTCGCIDEAKRCMGELDALRSLAEMADIELDIDEVV